MADLTVELVCRSEENLVVGNVVLKSDPTPGEKVVVNSLAVTRGLKNTDLARVPSVGLIMDGVQMTCRHCHGNLYFRARNGELFAAMPGSVEVVA